MHYKTAILVVVGLVSMFITACSNNNKLDPYDTLQVPPQIISIPTKESTSDKDDKLLTQGLGDKVKFLSSATPPMLVVEESFEKTWERLDQVLRHHKIRVTELNRDQGYLWVNFDVDKYAGDDVGKYTAGDGTYTSGSGLLEGFSNSWFGSHFGLRKYQLLLKTSSQQAVTQITATDMGAITKLADKKEKIEEVVDDKVPGPDDSPQLVLKTIFTSLHDGFSESILQHERLKRE